MDSNNQDLDLIAQAREEYEEELAERSKRTNERLPWLAAGIYGGGTVGVGAYKYHNYNKAAKLRKLNSVGDGARVAGKAGRLGAEGVNSLLTRVGARMPTTKALAMDAVGAGIALPFTLMRNEFVHVQPGFDKVINGEQFDYGKATAKYNWIIIMIDILLTFLPVVKIFDALFTLGVTLPVGIIEGLTNGSGEISKHVDWQIALDHAFAQVEYEKWQKEMQEKGYSSMSVDKSDKQKWFNYNPNELDDKQLLDEDIRKDKEEGKISDELYNFIRNLAKGKGTIEGYYKLSEEDRKKLKEEYATGQDYSWILNDMLNSLNKNVKKESEEYAWDEGISRSEAENKLLKDINNADRLFEAGEVSVGFTSVYMTAKEKFIVYHWLQGDDSYLRDADQATKDKLAEKGIYEYQDGQEEANIAATGAVGAAIIGEDLARQKKEFAPAVDNIKSYMKRRGFREDLETVKKNEQYIENTTGINEDNVDNKDKSDIKSNAARKLEYNYRVSNAGINWGFGAFHDLQSRDQIDYNDERYHGVKIKGVTDPETGTYYGFTEEVEAHEFFNNPKKYEHVLPEGVYVNSSGQLFYGDPAKGNNQEVGENAQERQELVDKAQNNYEKYYTQESSKGVYFNKTRGSVAGGTNFNRTFVAAGKASIAGGNRVKK